MKKKFIIKKIAAYGLATAMVFSMAQVPAVTKWQPPMVNVQASTMEALYTGTESLTTDKLILPEEDWGEDKPIIPYDVSISDITLTENFNMTADITIDADTYASLADEGDYLKLQGVVKVGEDWAWKDSQVIPYITQDSFQKDGDVYKTSIEIPFSDFEPDNLKGIYFVVVAKGFEGKITFSDVKLTEVAKSGVKEEQLIYSSTAARPLDVDFSELEAEDWYNPPAITYANEFDNVVLAQNAIIKGTVTVDSDLYNSLDADGSYIKLQSVVKLGALDDWTQSGDYPEFYKDDFTENDGKYSADFTAKLSDIKGGDLYEIIFRTVGVGAKGTVTISDVSISNVIIKDDDSLPEKEATVIDDFESYNSGDNTDWEQEAGWQYDAAFVPVVADFNGSNHLELPLDYTGCEGYTWSEAKIKKTFAEGIDVSAYNRLTYSLIYPKELDGSLKAKVFAKDAESGTTVIDKEGTIETTDLGNGYIKADVTIKFSPNSAPITELIIGTVGVSTSFKGSVYIDDITLSQYSAAADFVDITATPGEGSVADISKMPTTVSLADSEATDTTRALYAYLKGLDAGNQVLFGHQNDTFKHVSTGDGVYSDVKDITGSVSGIVGIDSLALTGAELGLDNTEEAVAKSIEISKAAASEGAIITLSTHMPNMSNSKIVKNADGTFDFSACDFAESKDLSNNCAEEVLPGGKYNAQFTAYLDIIAEYAKGLGDIPVLFRPFHENDGGWFWWGAASTDKQTYIAMYRYMEDYLEAQGVHNFIYVYSPGGPVTSEAKYLDRYPGDDYVDVIGFDYYDDYNSYPAEYSESFIENLEKTCTVVKSIADKKNKVAAISETGARVMKQDGSDNEGILVKNNPIKDQNWYGKVNEVAKKTGMSYFLLWANFGDTNFYVPYKYNETKGQELINEFIDFYNEDSSIFANGTNFYGNASEKAVTDDAASKEVSGYFTNVFSKMVIKEAMTIEAVVKNLPEGTDVSVVVANNEANTKVELPATKTDKGYTATLTADNLAKLGKTSAGSITLMAGDKELVSCNYISLSKDKEKLAKNVLEDFELYYGDDDFLNGTYSVNSAAGCNSTFSHVVNEKAAGKYSGSFNYTLKTAKNEVWTGLKKNLDNQDYSDYNAVSLWIKPDGQGQKLVIQLVSNGEDFEAHLTEFAKTDKAQYVTIPFDKLKGKNGGTFDASNVTNFAVWCNSIPGNATDVESSILLDDVQCVYLNSDELKQVDGAYKTSDSIFGSTKGKSEQPVDPGNEDPAWYCP
ncbi:MAG: glycosyl hydrolase [Coprococcus sp.]